MATDARGHTTPAGDDAPKRSDVLDLSLSIRDPIPVANTTARAAKIVELAALTPAITPSSSNPILFFRADAGDGLELEYTTDGSTFHTVPATPMVPSRTARGSVALTVSSAVGTSQSVTFPAGRFTATPKVFVSKQSADLSKYIPYVTTISSTGCTIGIYAGDGVAASGSVTVAWSAEQD